MYKIQAIPLHAIPKWRSNCDFQHILKQSKELFRVSKADAGTCYHGYDRVKLSV